MSRCAACKGANALGCCRAAGHNDNGPDGAGHCWHWLARLHGTPVHTTVTRAGDHPLVCVAGQGLDAG